MRVLILGGGGMLGHKAYQLISERFDTRVTFRRFDARLRATGLFRPDHVIEGVDAEDLASVRSVVSRTRPDYVVNCIGVIKQLPEAKNERISIYTNALFPHVLAEICAEASARLVHVSTDCVFSGERGGYTDDDPSDALDLYGRTKYLGEVRDNNALTLRTSIIGRDLFHDVSLVDWFLSQRGGRVRGFTNAIYTGVTTIVLAREIIRMISSFPTLSGIFQLSSDPIDKYNLLLLLRDSYGIDVEIDPYPDFHCDRSLRSNRYREITAFSPPSWPEMVREMAADPTPYDSLRTLIQAEQPVGR